MIKCHRKSLYLYIKPVYSGHLVDYVKVATMDRWSLWRGYCISYMYVSIKTKSKWPLQTGDQYRQMTTMAGLTVYGWSLNYKNLAKKWTDVCLNYFSFISISSYKYLMMTFLTKTFLLTVNVRIIEDRTKKMQLSHNFNSICLDISFFDQMVKILWMDNSAVYIFVYVICNYGYSRCWRIPEVFYTVCISKTESFHILQCPQSIWTYRNYCHIPVSQIVINHCMKLTLTTLSI